ncbi:SDR family NAD(P)-dependent oxidoreductase [Gordonia hongkongensis]|uniref:SDR family NAD(P)-dependent oxidoreductase n=1 Tax=Gordonia hongkongensis TaxID=1701090 RepID=A0AAX3TE58_9ACTN|nr:SDR family oxidoreductase [Gordonia hongkongensis]QIK50193.1 SDR family oxidoreductase [Gordonia terrae]WFP27121.1 SDR family NAD(P)-dependent oxidoreductase [Gordonia hongkongensis]
MAGRVVVVTGGSRGLGKAMCHHFAAEGDHVVVASRKLDACDELALELRRTYDVDAVGFACHVGSWTQCDALIDFVESRYGRIDVLINNAGMSPLYPSLPELSEELFDKVVAVNFGGPFRLAVRAGALMQREQGGSIVNISSIAAVQPQPYDLPYAAAKAALNTVTGGLARSFGPTVRVNAVMAGPFNTDVTAAWNDETRQKTAGDLIPLGRIGDPHEIVGAVGYLAGPAASYTTGAVIKVDGGMASMPA